MVRPIMKIAAKPLRPRVEVYAKTEDGKILAGKYPDGGVGVYGGGVDGDSLEAASKKEFREEGGVTIRNVKKIKGVKPMVEKWDEDHGEQGRKQKQRAEKFSGSKTFFMLADVKGKGKMVDGSKIKGVKPRTVEELINQQKKAVKNSDEERLEAAKIRLSVLQKLREKTAQVVSDGQPQPVEPALYAPEIYGHEAGHHAYQQRMGRFGKALDNAALVGDLAATGLGIYGLVKNKPGLMTAASVLGTATEAPRLAEETMASRHSLKELKDKLTPEEYDNAKRRLISAGATYYIPPALEAGTTALSLAGSKMRNANLQLAGFAAGRLSPFLKDIGTDYAAKKMSEPGGKRMTESEIRELHQQMAPDVALNVHDKPYEGGAFYMSRPEGKFNKWLADKMVLGDLKELGMDKGTKKDFMTRGGIHMAKTWTPQDYIRISGEGSGMSDKNIEKAIKKYEEKERKKEEKARLKAEKARV